ncbi:MAG: glutamine--fructose-6-phosphate transaminase (isomerizing), partial [Firmicutes bacterium]|nr:glutamine--fructose-6-phosphate transaminase (isomerizing) [Bacillota bacterium]
MCGIVGFVGENRRARTFIYEGLTRLEYRGYDSAGIALETPTGIVLKKGRGRLNDLRHQLEELPESVCGIGHTRWATHGKPTDENAHPHLDCRGQIAVVHNGIIENYRELREELIARGHHFLSNTDSEIIPHLLEEYGGQDNLEEAVRQAEKRLKGAYAFLAVSARDSQKIVAVRRTSPLVIGLGTRENYLASDFSAFLADTQRALVIEDGEMAVVTPHHVQIYDQQQRPVIHPVTQVTWNIAQAERGGYAHFMLKEIMEQPTVWQDALLGRIVDHRVTDEGLGLKPGELSSIRRVQIVAAGTAYHAGLVGKSLIERIARVPVDVAVASEFRYAQPVLEDGTWVMAISQSGETADTLACVKRVKEMGFPTYAMTNTVGSTLAREADRVVYTQAGPEIAVASTKAYTTQLLLLTLWALALADRKGSGRPDLVDQLSELPDRGKK